ncbi:MAG TPA: hypothetical protein V6D11_02645 [Waterburya sp.]|jgi:hypothetical protein
MKVSKTLSLLGAICVLGTVAACTPGKSNNAINPESSSSSINNSPAAPNSTTTPTGSTAKSTEATQTNQSARSAQNTTNSEKPSTKTDTISIEGEKTQVTLKLYDRANGVFTTYYPEKDFIAQSRTLGEGTGTQFIYNVDGRQNQNVFVALFFPTKATTLEQLKQVAQQRGLIQPDQWKVVTRTTEVPYSWAKEKIVYQKRGSAQNLGGEVYVGEANGKAFYVVTHYPAEYGDGFGPRANLILKNLQVND